MRNGRLRLGIDLSPIWRPSIASDKTVADGILEGLTGIAQDLEYDVVVAVDHHAPTTLPDEFDALEVVRYRGGPRMLTNPTTLLRAYRMADVDAGLYHHFGPWIRATPSVTLVHDIVHVDDPEAFGTLEARYLNLRRSSVRRSTRVLCPSETTAKELLRHGYRSDAEGIDIVMWGARTSRQAERPVPPSGLPQPELPFVLTVGRITERKRIPLAAAIVEACTAADRVVVAGPVEDDAIATALRRLPHVHVLGRVSDAELDWLYRNAQATVLASRSEGFGLPLIEAVQRGCPVLCSDLPVFREVTRSLPGVAFFPSGSSDPVAEASENLASLIASERPDPDRSAGRFSWDETARTVVASLRRAASGAAGRDSG